MSFSSQNDAPDPAKHSYVYQAPKTTVVNVHKADLNKHGYKDLEDWLRSSKHVYIGRDMTKYIPGAVGSKWGNPYKSKFYGNKEESCKLYKDHILNNPALFKALGDLKGKTLGCWCHPQQCHGHLLVQMVEEYCD